MSGALLNHLWQSTLFAAGAWAVAVAHRSNGANLRYWLWLAASMKFLIPFSLLGAIGSYLVPLALAQAAPGPVVSAIRVATTSLLTPASSTIADGSLISNAFYWLALAWPIGCAVVLIRWSVAWRRLRAVVRSAVPRGEIESVPLLASPQLREPGVFGILRPVLLMPDGIADRLTPEQLRAIIAHEICHVRRRDNLMSALHVLVECVFWFYPPVWWIGARLVEERERACDEHVVRAGHARRTYAEGILRVCESCVTPDPLFVAGVSGADLKSRIEAIMRNDVLVGLSVGKKWLLGVAASVAVAMPLLAGSTTSAEVHAQAASRSAAAKVELLPGKRVKLNYDHVEVRALLQGLAEAAGVNMLVSTQIDGEITVHLAEMPWDQALHIVLSSNGLAMRESNGIYFVDRTTAAAQAG